MKRLPSGARTIEVARLLVSIFAGSTLLGGEVQAALALSSQAFQQSEHNLGELLIETSAFLRDSEVRGNQLSTLTIHPDWRTDGEFFTSRLDLIGVAALSDQNSFTLESKEAFIATSPRFTGNHQIGAGRRDFALSALDAFWKTGTWTPRFQWSPLKPENVGNLAGYYQYQGERFRFIAYASPISLPERGYPVRSVQGELQSTSPDWVAPFEELSLLDRQVDIRYELMYPDLQELILQPTAGVHFRYGTGSGFWAQAGFARMPLHQAELALEASLLASSLTLDAKIHPRRNAHLLGSVEMGYQGNSSGVWVSLNSERPLLLDRSPQEADWIATPLGPSQLGAIGVNFSLLDGLRLDSSLLWIQEELPPPVPGEITLTTPSRYAYSNAARFRAVYASESAVKYTVEWTLDIPNQSSHTSLDLEYGLRSGVSLGVGADIIASSTGEGFIGQYFGNDKVRGRIAYAF
jgi:hypothetical protein